MRSVKPLHPYRREDGAVAVLVALMLVVLMAAVALAVDVGGLYLRRRELVNGADSAALAAARSCARGIGNDAPWSSPEDAADYQAQQNSAITSTEVASTNLTLPPGQCLQPSQYGRVSAQYTSMQALHFAPVLGFDNASPVTTAATASWGFGSNSSMPTVLSNLFAPGTCVMPPTGTIAIGTRCTFWYDNDALGGGNFTFLSLNAAGWDVPVGSQCPGSQAGGTSTLTKWVDGSLPTSVTLNWTKPTYVCTDSGIRGVGGKSGPNSQFWRAFDALHGQTRDFPINWEGCGTPPAVTACPPIPSAPAQSSIYNNGQLDKYDIIGFAAMTIDHVYGPNDAAVQGTPADDFPCTGKVPNNQTIPGSPTGTFYSWIDLAGRINGGPCKSPTTLPVDSVTTVNLEGLNSPTDYTFDTNGITLKTTLVSGKNVAFTLHNDAEPGICGDLTLRNNSAVCLVAFWQGDTITGDYSQPKDNITVIRLCDETLGNCLDQRHGLP
jgi:Flp pilus assembly protein TadG